VTFQAPPPEDFSAIVARGVAQLFLKSSGEPLPNAARYNWARWDAYVYAPEPDALADDFQAAGAMFSSSLKDIHDGLLGFEVTDPYGYLLFFGRPR
jgi:hypothetical protein